MPEEDTYEPVWRDGYDPFRTGLAAALCMASGDCHVGLIVGSGDGWVTIYHKDWLYGGYVGETRSVRVSDVVEVVYADYVPGNALWDDENLARTQTRWHEKHRAAVTA